MPETAKRAHKGISRSIHKLSLYQQKKENPDARFRSINSGETNASSPLMCVCKYFRYHLHAELETLDVGVAFGQSYQR